MESPTHYSGDASLKSLASLGSERENISLDDVEETQRLEVLSSSRNNRQVQYQTKDTNTLQNLSSMVVDDNRLDPTGKD